MKNMKIPKRILQEEALRYLSATSIHSIPQTQEPNLSALGSQHCSSKWCPSSVVPAPGLRKLVSYCSYCSMLCTGPSAAWCFLKFRRISKWFVWWFTVFLVLVEPLAAHKICKQCRSYMNHPTRQAYFFWNTSVLLSYLSFFQQRLFLPSIPPLHSSKHPPPKTQQPPRTNMRLTCSGIC